jgi:parallel beta-helix repeat protein
MRKGCMLFLLILCLFLTVPAGAAEIRVPTDFPTIQSAIDAAQAGDIIKVAQGTYPENLFFFLHNGVTLYGGYSPDFSVRDSTKYVTTIDGGKNYSTVEFFWAESNTIDGFTIQNGSIVGNGGGVHCYWSDPIISNNVIKSNEAIGSDNLGTGLGGGIYAEESAPQIVNNTISLNKTSGGQIGGGGGIALFNAYPETVIKGNTISDNTADKNGGGINILYSNPHIIENKITENEATDLGGGIAAYDASAVIEKNDLVGNKALLGGGLFCTGSENNPNFVENNIIGNQASDGGGTAFFKVDGRFKGNVVEDNIADRGGGLFCAGLTPAISNSVIAKNYAQQGGGILCAGSSPTVTNSIIAGNVAAKDGAVINCINREEGETPVVEVLSSPVFTNCTFVRNQAKSYGNIILQFSSNIQIANSIFWENQGDFILETSAQAGITYTHIRDPRYKGVSNNIFQDPMFFDLEAGDYSLVKGSPCIDAGSPSLAENDTDGTRNDMGAFGGPGAAGWTGALPQVPVEKIGNDAWNDLGLYGGQVTSIAIDPMNPEKIFATTYQGDGLFISNDQGTAWQSVPGFRNFECHQVAIDPNDPQKVWVVYNTFIARSEDGGNTWSRWRLPDARPAYAVAVHPQ